MAIDPIHGVMQVLRRQMAENLRQQGSAPRTNARAASAGPSASPRARRTGADTRRRVAQRLLALDPTTPDYLDQAADAFVDAVLQAEFGEDRLQAPAMRDLVQRVRQAMLERPALRDDMARLAVALRSGAAPR